MQNAKLIFVLIGASGFALAFVSTLLKMLRTGIFLSWRLARAESTVQERLMDRVGVVVAVLGFSAAFAIDHFSR